MFVPKNVAVHSQAAVLTVTVTVPRWPAGPIALWLQPSVSAWCQTASFGLPATTEKWSHDGSACGGVSRQAKLGDPRPDAETV